LEQDPCGKRKRIMQLVGVEDFGLPRQVISATKVLQNLKLVVLKYYKKQAHHAASWHRRFQKKKTALAGVMHALVLCVY
jgi:hypothetical protein